MFLFFLFYSSTPRNSPHDPQYTFSSTPTPPPENPRTMMSEESQHGHSVTLLGAPPQSGFTQIQAGEMQDWDSALNGLPRSYTMLGFAFAEVVIFTLDYYLSIAFYLLLKYSIQINFPYFPYFPMNCFGLGYNKKSIFAITFCFYFFCFYFFVFLFFV